MLAVACKDPCGTWLLFLPFVLCIVLPDDVFALIRNGAVYVGTEFHILDYYRHCEVIFGRLTILFFTGLYVSVVRVCCLLGVCVIV